MGLRNRARKLFGRDKKFEHSVCASRVDHAVFHDLRRRAAKVDEAVTTLPKLPSGDVLDGKIWERLAEDLWTEFYGDDEPSLRNRDRLDPRFHVNRQLADKNARDESFRSTRTMTRGKVTESALGLLGALESVAESYGDELAEHAERQNEIADASDRLDSIDDALAELRRQRQDAERTEAIDTQIRALAKEKREQVDAIEQAIEQQAHVAGNLIDAAAKAAQAAGDAAEESVKAASLLPGKGPGQSKRVPPDLMIEFANRVHGSHTLRRVLELMGKLELSMGNMRRQMRAGGFDEIVDIEMGNELRLVLPHEKMLLVHPTAKLDFYRRYHERSLMQYEMWSEQELKKGPLIVAADGSSSMSGIKNEFCRGLTLAACGIVNHEGRNCAAIEFGSSGQLREFWFPGNRPLDTEVALDFAEHFFAGGTDINQALVRAKELIDNEAPFHSADLLIVTDGGDVLTEQSFEIRDALRAMGVKIHGITVGIQPTQYLVEVCDHVSPLLDFAGPNAVTDRIAIDLT